MAGQGYIFNPIVRSGFQRKDDLLNIKIFNPDGSEATVTEVFERIDADLSGKVDKRQGTEHSGMVLYVNANGYVDRRRFMEITPEERERLANLPTYGLEQLSDTPESEILCSYQLYKVENGRKTYIGDKVNIPRDLFLEDVSVLDVSDEHPLPGYENGRYFKFVFRLADGSTKTTILPVSDLSPCVDNGHHTKIENSHVNVYDLVPQYSNINDVLDHEKVIQYIGETTEKFTHGYFYERGKGFVVKAGNNKSNISFPFQTQEYLLGTFWDNGVAADVDMYLYNSAMRMGDTGNFGDCASLVKCGVGDHLSNGNVELEVVAVETDGSIVVQGQYGDTPNARCHLKFNTKINTRQFVADDGKVVLYYGSYQSDIYIYCPTHKYKTSYDNITIAYINPYFGAGNLTHDIVVGSSGWLQLDVQPGAIPFDPSALENRVEHLEADSHKQNTDIALDTDKVVVTPDAVTIDKDLQLRANRAELGKYGTADTEKKYLLKVGNGSVGTPSDAAEMDYNGELHLAKDVTIGGSFGSPQRRMSQALYGDVCTFEEMMADYQPGNGKIYMIYE